MAENDNTPGARGTVRDPDPRSAGQDAGNLERQRQVERDRDALEAQRRRVEATTPPEVRDRTIGEMTREIEREGERG